MQCGGSVYVDEFKRGYFPESCPPSSHVTLTFLKKRIVKPMVMLAYIDGWRYPTERPLELEPNEIFEDGNKGNLYLY
jgi:hypothetical protein